MSSAEARFSDAATQAGFTPLWNAVLRNPELTAGARLLYATLSSYAWGSGSAFPGQERLAGDLGVSSRHVRRYTRELEAAGLVEVKRQGLRKPNLYLLHAPGSASSPAPDRTLTSAPDRTPMSAPERTPMSDEEDTEGKGRETSSLAPATADGEGASSSRKSKSSNDEQRETLYATLLEVCGIDRSKLTPAEARKYAIAAGGLRKADATPELIRKAAAAWPDVYKGAAITPPGIDNNFGRLLAGAKAETATGQAAQRTPAEKKAHALKWASGRASETFPDEDDFLAYIDGHYAELDADDRLDVLEAYRAAKKAA